MTIEQQIINFKRVLIAVRVAIILAVTCAGLLYEAHPRLGAGINFILGCAILIADELFMRERIRWACRRRLSSEFCVSIPENASTAQMWQIVRRQLPLHFGPRAQA